MKFKRSPIVIFGRNIESPQGICGAVFCIGLSRGSFSSKTVKLTLHLHAPRTCIRSDRHDLLLLIQDLFLEARRALTLLAALTQQKDDSDKRNEEQSAEDAETDEQKLLLLSREFHVVTIAAIRTPVQRPR